MSLARPSTDGPSVSLFSDDIRLRLHQAARPDVEPGAGGSSPGAPFGQLLPGGRLCWAANGPYLEVLCAVTGQRRAQWTFGHHLPGRMVQITAVRCVPDCGGRPVGPLLVVGLDCGAGGGGLVCVFDVSAAAVTRAVRLSQRVTALGLAPLPLLGTAVAVGTQDGHVLLVSLALDDAAAAVTDEHSPGALAFTAAPDAGQEPTACLLQGMERGRYLSMRLNPDAVAEDGVFVYCGPNTQPVRLPGQRVWVSCVEYVPQICSLVVGYSFGSFQLLNLDTICVEYASQYEEGLSPMVGCVYLEPENDPRRFVYLWALLSVPAYQDWTNHVGVAALFSLLYARRQWTRVGQAVYRQLQHAEVRLVYELTASLQQPRPDLVAAGCLLAAYPLPEPAGSVLSRRTPSPIMPSMQLDDGVEDESCWRLQAGAAPGFGHQATTRCALVWEAWPEGGGPAATVLAVFDLNAWYAAHMPSQVSATALARSPFLRFLSLDVRQGIVMDARLAAFTSADDTCPLRVTALLDEGVQQLSFPSSLQRLLIRMKTDLWCPQSDSGAAVDALYEAALTERLLEPVASGEDRRSALLTLALDSGGGIGLPVLRTFAMRWLSVSDRGQGNPMESPLRWLLEWVWQRAVDTVKLVDDVSASLFSPVPDLLEEGVLNRRQTLHAAGARLDALIGVLNAMLRGAPGGCTEAGATELHGHRLVLNLRRQHLSVMVWLSAAGLLPEQPDNLQQDDEDADLDPAVFWYPCTQLDEWYREQRSRLGSDLMMIEGLIDEMGAEVRCVWQEEQEDAFYPPRSLHTLTRVYLLDGIPDQNKHRLTHYLLLDLSRACETLDDAVLKSFPSSFCMSPGWIKLTHGFWHLDRGELEAALVFLLDPLVQKGDLAVWQVRRCLESLLAQGAPRAALQLARVRFNSCTTPGDVRLHVRILLENGLVAQAVRKERQHRDIGGMAALRWLLEMVQERSRLVDLTQLVLDQFQEQGFIDFLLKSARPKCHELLYSFYLQRGRYADATALHGQLQERSSFRDAVQRLLPRILPMELQLKPTSDSTAFSKQHQTDRRAAGTGPLVPLSARLLKANVSVRSRSAIIQTMLDEDAAPEKDRTCPTHTPFRPRGKRRRVVSGGSDPDLDDNGLSYITDKTPDVVRDSSAVKLRPSMRQLLQTPPVRRSFSATASLNTSLTPSILKRFSAVKGALRTDLRSSQRSHADADELDSLVPKRPRLELTHLRDAHAVLPSNESSARIPTIFTPGHTPRRPNFAVTVQDKPSPVDAGASQHSGGVVSGVPSLIDLKRSSIHGRPSVVYKTLQLEEGSSSDGEAATETAPKLPTIYTPGRPPKPFGNSRTQPQPVIQPAVLVEEESSPLRSTGRLVSAQIPTIFTPGKPIAPCGPTPRRSIHSKSVVWSDVLERSAPPQSRNISVSPQKEASYPVLDTSDSSFHSMDTSSVNVSAGVSELREVDDPPVGHDKSLLVECVRPDAQVFPESEVEVQQVAGFSGGEGEVVRPAEERMSDSAQLGDVSGASTFSESAGTACAVVLHPSGDGFGLPGSSPDKGYFHSENVPAVTETSSVKMIGVEEEASDIAKSSTVEDPVPLQTPISKEKVFQADSSKPEAPVPSRSSGLFCTPTPRRPIRDSPRALPRYTSGSKPVSSSLSDVVSSSTSLSMSFTTSVVEKRVVSVPEQLEVTSTKGTDFPPEIETTVHAESSTVVHLVKEVESEVASGSQADVCKVTDVVENPVHLDLSRAPAIRSDISEFSIDAEVSPMEQESAVAVSEHVESKGSDVKSGVVASILQTATDEIFQDLDSNVVEDNEKVNSELSDSFETRKAPVECAETLECVSSLKPDEITEEIDSKRASDVGVVNLNSSRQVCSEPSSKLTAQADVHLSLHLESSDDEQALGHKYIESTELSKPVASASSEQQLVSSAHISARTSSDACVSSSVKETVVDDIVSTVPDVVGGSLSGAVEVPVACAIDVSVSPSANESLKDSEYSVPCLTENVAVYSTSSEREVSTASVVLDSVDTSGVSMPVDASEMETSEFVEGGGLEGSREVSSPEQQQQLTPIRLRPKRLSTYRALPPLLEEEQSESDVRSALMDTPMEEDSSVEVCSRAVLSESESGDMSTGMTCEESVKIAAAEMSVQGSGSCSATNSQRAVHGERVVISDNVTDAVRSISSDEPLSDNPVFNEESIICDIQDQPTRPVYFSERSATPASTRRRSFRLQRMSEEPEDHPEAFLTGSVIMHPSEEPESFAVTPRKSSRIRTMSVEPEDLVPKVSKARRQSEGHEPLGTPKKSSIIQRKSVEPEGLPDGHMKSSRARCPSGTESRSGTPRRSSRIQRMSEEPKDLPVVLPKGFKARNQLEGPESAPGSSEDGSRQGRMSIEPEERPDPVSKISKSRHRSEDHGSSRKSSIIQPMSVEPEEHPVKRIKGSKARRQSEGHEPRSDTPRRSSRIQRMSEEPESAPGTPIIQRMHIEAEERSVKQVKGSKSGREPRSDTPGRSSRVQSMPEEPESAPGTPRRSFMAQRLSEEPESAPGTARRSSRVQRMSEEPESAPGTPRRRSRVQRMSEEPESAPGTARRSSRIQRMSVEPEDLPDASSKSSKGRRRSVDHDTFSGTPRRSSRIQRMSEEPEDRPSPQPTRSAIQSSIEANSPLRKDSKVYRPSENAGRPLKAPVISEESEDDSPDIHDKSLKTRLSIRQKSVLEQQPSKCAGSQSKLKPAQPVSQEPSVSLQPSEVEPAVVQVRPSKDRRRTHAAARAAETSPQASSARKRRRRTDTAVGAAVSTSSSSVSKGRPGTRARFLPSDEYVSPIRLLSDDVVRRLSVAQPRVESPAARVRRAALKRAKRRSGRDCVRLW